MHPVVVFAVLDHYKRRKKNQETVIGTLLGTTNPDGSIVIKNCFPLEELKDKSGDPAMHLDYHHQMLSLHQRVNRKEVVVGWYSSGQDLTFAHTKINEMYRKEVRLPRF